MRRLISWLIMVPTAVAVVVFALNNKEPIALNLWPFAMVIEVQLYLLLTVVLGAGVVLGGVVSWAGGGRVRSQLRKRSYEGEVARRELQTEREKTTALEAELKALKNLSEQVSVQTNDHAQEPDAKTIEHSSSDGSAGQLPKPQNAA